MSQEHVAYPGRDPVGPLEFMTGATRIPFQLKLMDGGWISTRYQLMQAFDSRLEGMYELLLGDETKLTDTTAEYVIYVEPEEAEKANIIIEYITNG